MTIRMLTLLLAASVLGFTGSASALTFPLDSYVVLENASDPGLVHYWNPILTTPPWFDPKAGKSQDFRLFETGMGETHVHLDDIFWQEIHAGFNFSSPSTSGDKTGATRGRFLFPDRVARWDGPGDSFFGDAGLFTIILADFTLDVPGMTDGWAAMHHAQAPGTPVGPVPEPSTLVLLGTGLLGITVAGKKRIFRKSK